MSELGSMEWCPLDEELAAEVHNVYCKAYERRFGKPYWTNGDYSKLDKETQDYDRAFVLWHKLYSGKLRKELSESQANLKIAIEALEIIRNVCDDLKEESFKPIWREVCGALAKIKEDVK